MEEAIGLASRVGGEADVANIDVFNAAMGNDLKRNIEPAFYADEAGLIQLRWRV